MDEFFKDTMSKPEFAQLMRRFLHTVICMQLEQEDQSTNVNEISQGYYFLTEFLELLDPCLTKE